MLLYWLEELPKPVHQIVNEWMEARGRMLARGGELTLKGSGVTLRPMTFNPRLVSSQEPANPTVEAQEATKGGKALAPKCPRCASAYARTLRPACLKRLHAPGVAPHLWHAMKRDEDVEES